MSQRLERRSGACGFLISLLVFLCAQPGLVSAQESSGLDLDRLIERTADISHRPGELIVRFTNGAQPPSGLGLHGPLTKRAVRNIISDAIIEGAAVEDEYDSVVPGLTRVTLPATMSVLDAVIRFNASPNVVYAEPNYKIKALVVPDDPRFIEQWGLDNTGQTGGLPNADVNAPEAWDIINSVPDIIVAIADSGIDYNHPDLIDNIWINDGEVNEPGVVGPNDVNDADDDGNGYNDDFYGYDFVDDDADPMDEHFHGTHVAGIVGAIGNNTTGVAGVCWSVKLMALRILDENGDGSTAEALMAIQYAVDMGAHVINASWGTYNFDQALYDAIEAAGEAGIVVVAAAGNDAYETSAQPPGFGIMFPAGFSGIGGLDNVISVLATNHFDNVANFSNYSPIEIDLGAPGDGILSTTPTTSTDAMDANGVGTDYDFLSGTSQAAPFVTGAVALIKGVSSQWTPDQIRQIIMRTVDPVLPGMCVSGGRLNLFRTVTAARVGAVVNRRTGMLYPTIQEAIDDAQDYDYLVADANNWYFEKVDFGGKKVFLRSGDVNDYDLPNFLGVASPRTTFISGLFDGGPIVTFASGEGPETSISGFTIVDSNMEGVYFEGSSPDFNECIVAGSQGSGLFCLASSPSITRCTISQNVALMDGGGIFLQGGSSPNIVDSIIMNNVAAMNGGGICCVADSDPNITGGAISGNTAYDGGGIYCDDSSDPNIARCSISGNAALGEPYLNVPGNGGGIYCLSQMIANGVTILGNDASGWGGGLFCGEGATPNMTSCMIAGNMAQWQGGGIYSGDSAPEIFDCAITANRTAWDGGGMYFEGGEPNVINSTITSNVADYDGGAIYCYASGALIKNCLIVDNAVESWDGGGVFCLDASPAILNCTFVRNSANNFDGVGGAVYCTGTSEPSIVNCIFNDHDHIAIYEYDPQSDPEVAFCLFYDNRGGDYYDFDSDNIYDVNSNDPNGQDPNNLNFIPDGMASANIKGDPMFVPGRLGEFYLSQFEAGQILDANGEIVDPAVNPQDATSPAVDAGSTAATTLGMSVYSTRTDNYEDPNTGEKDLGTVDIGYHYDDPRAPQTYMLMTMAVPGGSGLISPDPGGSYVQYAQVALEASPVDPNVYQFKSWTGTDDDTRMDLTPSGGIAAVQINIVTMDGAKTVIAEFETVFVTLRTRVVAGNGTVTPRGGKYRRGRVVDLTATPADPAQVIGWTGTDDDYSTLRTNTVTMSEPFMLDPAGREFKEVEVVFYTPRELHVPDEYTSIQYAIDDANNGDIIVIAEADEPYLTVQGFYIYKAITITGSNPDDPSSVARTIIEEQPEGPDGSGGQAFLLWGVGPDAVLNGITIRGFNLVGTNGQGGNPDQGYYDGIAGTPVYGSAILCIEASPTIKNCVITDCNATGGNGGNGANGNNDHADFPRLDGGHGGWPGGAGGGGMACLAGSNPTVTNCIFQNCNAVGGDGGDGGNGDDDPFGYGGRGGGWYYSFAPWTPYDWGPFEFYTAYSGNGGAVYIDETSSPTFRSCAFNNNNTESGLCGISGQNNPGGFRDEPTIRWQIDNSGGAVFIGYVSEYSILIGGPIVEGPSRARFQECTFTNNYADPNTTDDNEDAFISYGGAVAFVDGAEPTFENCSFSSNLATVGGGVYGKRSNSVLAGSSFASNSAYRGGGAHIAGGSTEIARSRFTANLASSVIDVYIDPNDPNLILIDPNLLVPPIGSGGAICFVDADATILDSTILNNNTQVSGGGIFISGSEPVLVRNCLVTNNSTGRDGGGISVNWSAKPQIINCTIADNSVTGNGFAAGYGGGLYGSYTSATTVINSILWGNAASLGMQIAVGTGFEFDQRPADVNVLYSDVQGGAMAAFVDTDCTFNFGANSIMADPLFVAGPLDAYYLSQVDSGQSVNSPAVDAGNADANELDLDTYTTRTSAIPDSGVVDMGYHRSVFFEDVEYRFVLRVIGPGEVAVEPSLIDPNNPLYDPNSNIYTFANYGGSTFTLRATPEQGYRVKRWTGADNDPGWNRNSNTVTLYRDRTVVVEFERDTVKNLLVPDGYRTIEEAVAAASPGDTNIIVDPGVHYVTDPNGIDLQGKSITLMSTDPDDPDIVARTIIDCRGTRFVPRRAFRFHSGEDPNTVIAGFTIRNGLVVGVAGINGGIPGGPVNPGDQNSPYRAASGTDAQGIGYGGGILCENRSSPTIKNCVITDCTVVGAWGGDGINGPYIPSGSQADGVWGGHGGNGTGYGWGGGIACLGQSCPVIVGCTLQNNAARGGCGGNGGNGSNPNDGSGRESWGGNGGNAEGEGYGGGIYCENGSTPTIVDCNFVNNVATSGIFGNGGSPGPGSGLSDPYPNPAGPGSDGFVLVFGGIAGGAAYYSNADVSFVNCRFIDNKAYEAYPLYYVYSLYDPEAQDEARVFTRGGALYSGPGNGVTLESCEFWGSLGGAVYVEPMSALDANDCFFKDNQAVEQVEGGSYYYYTPYQQTLIGPTIVPPEHSGGAVYLGSNCTGVNFRDCDFYSNYAQEDGGAIKCESDVSFVHCSFGGNRASGIGGGVEIYHDTGDPNTRDILTVQFQSCSFGGNQANESLYGWGGGAHIQDFNAVFDDCHFIGNSAKNGAGLFLAGGSVTMTGGIISGNEAMGGSGIVTAPDANAYDPLGASYAYYEMLGRFGRIEPIDLGAGTDMGGGLVCADTEAMIEDCTFSHNKAEGINGSGGAINFHGGFVEHVLKNCLLTGNSANAKGGAVCNSSFATPKLQNCTFSENTAGTLGGAVYCDWGSDATISDCIFKSSGNHAIGEQDFGNSVIRNCLFHDNLGGDYGIYDRVTLQTDTMAGADIDITNIEGDPLFVTGPLGAFYLSQIDANQAEDSPAVDAGSAYVSTTGMDMLTTRTDGGKDTDVVDMGYHYRDHSEIPKYTLTATVLGGHGTISPTTGTYFAGTPVTLTAAPEAGWRVAGWVGTNHDASTDKVNLVVMGPDRHVAVEFEQPRTIKVGSDPNFTSIQHAIDAAKDGDVVLIKTGTYYPAFPYPYIEIFNKNITLTSENPDDPEVVGATVLRTYRFYIYNVGPETIIDGLTIRDNNWFGADGADGGNPDSDGFNGVCVEGGAMVIFNASPTIRNCVFRDCSVTGGDGGNGSNGNDGHPLGYDGGWAGWAYGGAVYCGYLSSPSFQNCSFTDCYARGGNGGDGGDGIRNSDGGRGGSWEWPPTIEEQIRFWWDGWQWGPYDIDGYYTGSLVGTFGYYKDYWKYSGYGGAVYCENYSSPKFWDCTFTGNRTYGGVCGIGGTVVPTPSRNMNIENFGGAFYGCYGSSPEFVRCVFRDNIADTNTVILPDDVYVSYGGSLAFEDDCEPTFIDCIIADSAACIGGGMYWSNANVTVLDSNIVDNTGYHGGGLYSVEATGKISGSLVALNEAFVPPIEPNDPNISVGDASVIFGRGGGYYCLSSIVEVNDTVFTENEASSSGGGVYFVGSDQDMSFSPILHNCLLTTNRASRDGGAISVNWNAEPTISNCTIADNIVSGAVAYGGGLFCGYDSNTVVIDSIIWGNEGVDGSQIAVGTGNVTYGARPSHLRVTYSDIEPEPNEVVGPTKLDLVFCIDTTGSMWDDIDAVKAASLDIIDRIAEEFPDFRMAVVDYRDINEAPYGDPAVDYPFNDDMQFEADVAAIQAGIDALTLGAGADWRESVYSALMHCIDANSLGNWRSGSDVRRAILLVGDAPPHDPEPTTGYRLADVITAAKGADPIGIFAIPVDGDPITTAYFNLLAGGTGGALLQAADANEVIDAVMAAIGLMWRPPVTIYVEDDCVLDWWNVDSNSWDPESHNIGLDPNFTAGYYLSQKDSGQLIDSVCVDAGSGDANDPRIALDDHTTRTDGVGDANIVDMGYHHGEGLIQYRVIVNVVVDPNDPNGVAHGYVDPNVAIVYKDFGSNVVTLTAVPDDGYKVKQWTGTDDDTSTDRIVTVTVTEDTVVTVEFEPAPLYCFRMQVIDRGDGPHGSLVVQDPNSLIPPDANSLCDGLVYDGMTIALRAIPDPNYEVRRWFGTDNDLSREPNSTVTVRGADAFVAVEFSPAGQNVINLYNAFGTLDRRSPFVTIQDAINVADNGYEVVLSDGIYSGVGNYNLNLSAGLDPNEVRPITVRSENGPDNCIIDCEGLGRGFIFDSNEDPNYVINGLTIRGGMADNGGAIQCVDSSPEIRNCKITGNYATGNGGGIYLTNSAPIIVNTEISNNMAGGFGGGIYGEDASIAEIINCLIVRNYSSDIGGAIFLWASDATINLCTIAYNYGLSYDDLDGPKGGIACRDANPTITNSIIGRSSGDYGEWGDSFQGDDLYNCSTSNSCVENGDDAGSNGNIDDDPLWVTGSLGDFYLSQFTAGQLQDSPCIDAGEQYILQQLQTTYNLGSVTTSILNQNDTGFADMGYHYRFFTGPPMEYTLSFSVIGNGSATISYFDYTQLVFDYNGVTIEVNEATSPVILDLTPGTYLQLTARPGRGFRLRQWTGTDNDSSVALTNTVYVDSSRIVTVEFEPRITRTINVPGDYTTIQSAVFAAREGDTIVVDPGRYFGGYQGVALIIDKSVTVTSANPGDPCCVEATVIDGYIGTNPDGWHNLGVIFSSITDANTVLNGFTIENCGGVFDSGDDGDRGQGHPNGEDGLGAIATGILVEPLGGPVIKNCVIRNNYAVGGDGGDGENADADNNAGRGGWGGWAQGGGVYCGVYSTPTFINCRIEDNEAHGGNGGNGGDYAFPGGSANYGGNYSRAQAYNYDPDSPNIEYEPGNLWEVWEWDYATTYSYLYIAFDVTSVLTLYYDPNYAFLFDPNLTSYAGDYRWYSAYGGGAYCDKGSSVTFEHCEIRGNRTYGGMSGQGGVMGPGGRFQEPLVPYELPTYGAGVYCAEATTVRFAGCTFEDNFASQVDPTDPNHRLDPYNGYGGGVAAEMGATVSFADCNFVDNWADSGGGIYVDDVNALVVDCNIVSNRALRGGGFLGIGGSVQITASKVMRNWATLDPNDPNDDEVLASGGGLCYWSGDASIRDCNISGNRADASGGGVYLRGEGGPSVINCLIVNNAAGRDGGGASITWSADPLIRNCTFVDNAASGTVGEPNNTGLGGALYCGYGSDCKVTDTIFGGNYGIQGSAIAVGTGFAADPNERLCAMLDVSYSNIKPAPNDIWVDFSCAFEPNQSNVIFGDPLFVTGLLGHYYLSQLTAGQPRRSPCVNAGSDFAANLGMTRYTTRTDSVPDRNIVDMGYHYPLTEPCRFSDLQLIAEGILRDGVIDLADLRVLALRWLDQGCAEDDGWCGGADISFDTSVDLKDLAFLADCWRVEDNEAPIPNPSEWEEEPNMVASGTITMTAETAHDAWGWDVEYYFDCVFGNCNDSGWQKDPSYTDSGLSQGSRYGYRVRAREARGNCDDPNVSCNPTGWSAVRYAGKDDLTPPQPAPYIASIDPNSSSEVQMLATIAYDESGVEYYFESDPNYPGGHDSDWQSEPNYTDTDLDPDTVYRYRVKARDLSDNQNETPWSDWRSVRTPVAPDMTAPTPDPMEWADPNGAPREFWRSRVPDTAPGDFDCWIQMMAATATDASGGVEYYFECIDDPTASSGWQVDPYYEVYVYRGNKFLRWRVRAQDQYGNKTGWSDVARTIASPLP